MLNISNLTKIQGGEKLYSKVTFQINPGEKVGLVGPNGTGKSTLFKMIVKEITPDEGQISFPDGMTLAYFSQNVGSLSGDTAINIVMNSNKELAELGRQLKEFEVKLCDPDLSAEQMNKTLEKMGDVQTRFEKLGGYDVELRAAEILTGLGVKPQDHYRDIGEFSGGWKMRIALAKILVLQPDLILMDEPTNYLDMETILWLEQWLQNYEGAIFMTTHDRYFMNNVCKKTVEVFNRKVTVYSGNYDYYLKERQVRLDQLKAEYSRQQAMLQKEEEFIAKFKARASHAAQVQSRVKKLEKIDRIELPPSEEVISFEFQAPPRGSDDVVIIKDLKKSWDKNGKAYEVFSGLTATVKRLQKIAIVGVNGAGKSTLLKCICNQTQPSAGTIAIGPSVKLGYFSQYSLESLNAENTVFDEVRSVLNEASDGYIRNLSAAFLFKGDDVKKKVKVLSGGEKSRL
ncbi:MAG: ATP-binding cassette domain-containing protein, partial [Bacteriovoracaceae bacterium]|nr:ATP-binding cassette domain-containing protein [Bacteriovoracaceae bacterium]